MQYTTKYSILDAVFRFKYTLYFLVNQEDFLEVPFTHYTWVGITLGNNFKLTRIKFHV